MINVKSNIANKVLIILLSFVTNVIVVRILGPTDNGYIVYFLLIFNLVGSYADIGINNATMYFQKRTKYEQCEVYSTNVTYLLMLSILILIIILLLKTNNLIMINYSYYLVVLGIIYAITNIYITSLNSFYIGNERIIQLNKYNRITQIIRLLLIILLAIIKILHIYSYVLILVIMQIFNVILLLKKVNIKYEFKINKILLLKELKFGLVIYLSTLFIYLNYRSDQFIINNLIGLKDLGIYSVAVSLAELAFLIPNSIASAYLAKLYNIKYSDKSITSTTIKYTFYCCVVICAIGFFMSSFIPIIYGQPYSRATEVIKILFFGIIFASIGKIGCSYCETIAKNQVHLVITFISMCTNIMINLKLVPKYGISGSAIASSVSYILYGSMYIFYFIYYEKFLWSDLFIFNYIDKKVFINIIKRIFNLKEKVQNEL